MISSLLKISFSFARKPLSTQIFAKMTNKQLATPQLMRKLLAKPLHMHSRVSQSSLYHKKRVRHAVRSCFSEKKTKVFKKVNKVKQRFYSDILRQELKLTCSKKAIRCIRKAGSFDNYILVTKPKDLDSKKGQYLRELMLRKINDEDYRVPYIIGSKQYKRVKTYHREKIVKRQRTIVIPKEFKETYRTLQRPFGKSVEQLSEEDYVKYQELQELKRKLGQQLEENHPLLVQLKEKMSIVPENNEQKLREMAEEAKHRYLNVDRPKYREQIKRLHEKSILQYQTLSVKYKEAYVKYQSLNQAD